MLSQLILSPKVEDIAKIKNKYVRKKIGNLSNGCTNMWCNSVVHVDSTNQYVGPTRGGHKN